MPLETMTTQVPSVGVNEATNDDLLATNTNDGDTAVTRKSTEKKTNKLTSSLLVRGRHDRSTEKKTPASQTTKTKAQGGNIKPSRSSIFVLLGLTD